MKRGPAHPWRSRSRRARRELTRRAGLAAAALLLGCAALTDAGRDVLRAGMTAGLEAVRISRADAAYRPESVLAALRYRIPFDLAADIDRAARAEGVEPDLAFRLVRIESEFYESAVSPAGALGLTQLMPATAAELQPAIGRDEIIERSTNLRLGFRYLRWLLDEYDGDVEEALHAYNRGIGTVRRIRAAGGDPANGYARRVLGADGASAVGVPDAVRRREAVAELRLHEMAPAPLPTRER